MNILLITTDQQRADALGCVNPAVPTPHLDRLAAAGIRFDRAYTVNPVCTPSRCSLLTGHFPSRHGCWHVGTGLPEDYAPNVASRLAAAGYFTGLLGKAHFQPCYRAPESFESEPNIHRLEFFRDWRGPYYGFDLARLVIGHTAEGHACGMHYGLWLKDQGVDLGRYFGTLPYAAYGPWDLPAELHGSRWVADETMAAIDQARTRRQPFFLWASFQDPHNPYVAPEPWASMVDPGRLPLPRLDPAEGEGKPWFYRSLQEGRGYAGDPGIGEAAWGDCRLQPEISPAEARRVHAAYYGMMGLVDHHVGRILGHLAATGLDRDTLVVFTSDHGDYLGHHNLWGKGLPTYEDIQRLPFVVRHPAVRTPGRVSAALQSLVDVPATLLEVAGLPPEPSAQGVSQAAAWLDADVAARAHVRLEFRPSAGPLFQETFVTDRWKLVLYRDRPELGELYDLGADPHQARNLWLAKDFREVRDALSARFAAERVPADAEACRPRTAMA